MARPGVRIRITGQAPVQAKVYELQRLRCHLCGKVFTAQVPEGVGAAILLPRNKGVVVKQHPGHAALFSPPSTTFGHTSRRLRSDSVSPGMADRSARYGTPEPMSQRIPGSGA